MENKHTPGPWTVDCNQLSNWNCEGMQQCTPFIRNSHPDGNGMPSEDGLCVVSLKCTIKEEEGLYESLPRLKAADALLIAASPELLLACQAAKQCIDDLVEVYKRGGSMLVFDEAIKSLRDDAGKLVEKALKKATVL